MIAHSWRKNLQTEEILPFFQCLKYSLHYILYSFNSPFLMLGLGYSAFYDYSAVKSLASKSRSFTTANFQAECWSEEFPLWLWTCYTWWLLKKCTYYTHSCIKGLIPSAYRHQKHPVRVPVLNLQHHEFNLNTQVMNLAKVWQDPPLHPWQHIFTSPPPLYWNCLLAAYV